MNRVAFKMKLLPGNEAEYKRRHDAIWPELQQQLKAVGVSDYAIYLDSATNELLAVLKVDDPQKLDTLPREDVMQRWWRFMADIMETNPDHSPRSWSLTEMFYLP
jgi:L-rhamnose mutarotase